MDDKLQKKTLMYFLYEFKRIKNKLTSTYDISE